MSKGEEVGKPRSLHPNQEMTEAPTAAQPGLAQLSFHPQQLPPVPTDQTEHQNAVPECCQDRWLHLQEHSRKKKRSCQKEASWVEPNQPRARKMCERMGSPSTCRGDRDQESMRGVRTTVKGPLTSPGPHLGSQQPDASPRWPLQARWGSRKCINWFINGGDWHLLSGYYPPYATEKPCEW